MAVLCPNQLSEQQTISVAHRSITCTRILVTSKFALVYCDSVYWLLELLLSGRVLQGTIRDVSFYVLFSVFNGGGRLNHVGRFQD